MITFDAGNVLLKPAQKKQFLARLKRAMMLGSRLGDFVMKITLRRTGKHVEVTASGHDRFGDFSFRTKSSSWMHAMHSVVRSLIGQIRMHTLQRAYVRA